MEGINANAKTKKLVYVSVGDMSIGGKPASLVYCIDPYSESKRGALYPVLTKQPHISFGFASFGSKLYVIGGDDQLKGRVLLDKSDSVLVCETSNTAGPLTWRKACPTIVSRLNPRVVSTKDRLFVFSCWKEDSSDSWAEFYFPGSGDTWHPVCPSYHPLNEDAAMIAGIINLEEEKSLLLVTLDKGVIRLDYSDCNYRWHYERSKLAMIDRWSLRTAVLDRIIFVYRYDCIAAYDRDGDYWTVLDGIAEYLPGFLYRKVDPPGSLLNLDGNKLFLLWSTPHSQSHTKMELHWARFQVLKTADHLYAHVEASGIYDVDGDKYNDACTTCVQEPCFMRRSEEHSTEDDYDATPKKDADSEMYGGADEQLEKVLKTDRFKPDKGFSGAGERAGPRDKPVEFEQEQEEADPFGLDQFFTEVKKRKKALEKVGSGGTMRAPVEFEQEQEEADPFGLDQFFTEVKKRKKALEKVGSGGTMRASAGSSMRDGDDGGSGRTRIGFERGR